MPLSFAIDFQKETPNQRITFIHFIQQNTKKKTNKKLIYSGSALTWGLKFVPNVYMFNISLYLYLMGFSCTRSMRFTEICFVAVPAL